MLDLRSGSIHLSARENRNLFEKLVELERRLSNQQLREDCLVQLLASIANMRLFPVLYQWRPE